MEFSSNSLRERIEALARKQSNANPPKNYHTSSYPMLRLATRKINAITRVLAVTSSRDVPTFAWKLKLRDFSSGRREIVSLSFRRIYSCKTEVRLLRREGEGREETASDLPSLIFIGNERISFAFFLSVHDFARIITR